MTSRLRLLLALALLGVAVACACGQEAADLAPWTYTGATSRARLADGTTLQGGVYASPSGDVSASAFLGVPFAEPPVGELRWRMPVPWSGGGAHVTINATQFAPVCPQLPNTLTPFAETSEDCLYLNVYVPSTSGPSSSGLLPVMVFIYGGSFNSGATSLAYYNGLPLAAGQDVIVVTLAYRVGQFGFLALPELAAESGLGTTGNYGIQDQRLALGWVQANIAAFGGDATQVTLFGESAGAISVCVHLVSFLSRGLFARTIHESGDCNLSLPLVDGYAQGAALTAALGCSDSNSASTLACLRAASMNAVLSALPDSHIGLQGGASFSPVIDGYEMNMTMAQALATGVHPPLVPTILGTNLNEATLFVMTNVTMAAMSQAQLFDVVAAQFGPTLASKILAQYPLSAYSISAPAEVWASILSDVIFRCPTWFAANALAAANATVLRYSFNFIPNCGLFPPAYASLFGVYHFADIPYVFGVSPPACNFSQDDEVIRNLFQANWGSWAHGVTPWLAYTSAERSNIVIDVPASIETDYDAARCEFWLNNVPQQPSAARAALRAQLLKF